MHPETPAVALTAITALFIVTLAAFVLLLKRSLPPRAFRIGAVTWVVLQVLQCAIAATGFYTRFDAMPPRFALVLLPSFAAVAVFALLAHRAGRIARPDVGALAYFQSFRLPLEIFVLHELYTAGLMSRHMTYEGWNYDVVIGLTALGAGWYAARPTSRDAVIAAWNALGIASLAVIMVVAILTLPTPFQQFSLEQPNIAPAYAPFILLPAFFVPAALWGHIVSLIALRRRAPLPAPAASTTAAAAGGPAAATA